MNFVGGRILNNLLPKTKCYSNQHMSVNLKQMFNTPQRASYSVKPTKTKKAAVLEHPQHQPWAKETKRITQLGVTSSQVNMLPRKVEKERFVERKVENFSATSYYNFSMLNRHQLLPTGSLV